MEPSAKRRAPRQGARRLLKTGTV